MWSLVRRLGVGGSCGDGGSGALRRLRRRAGFVARRLAATAPAVAARFAAGLRPCAPPGDPGRSASSASRRSQPAAASSARVGGQIAPACLFRPGAMDPDQHRIPTCRSGSCPSTVRGAHGIRTAAGRRGSRSGGSGTSRRPLASMQLGPDLAHPRLRVYQRRRPGGSRRFSGPLRCRPRGASCSSVGWQGSVTATPASTADGRMSRNSASTARLC